MNNIANYIAILLSAIACAVAFFNLEDREHKFLFLGIMAYLLMLGVLNGI